ncbi:helix-hairpin-helix domain-containing protein [Streptomyces sp. NPDC018031]|uniref:helix-hairpin-helix domain-containing protein n=1 Tax=Streptomyces sp. NPDC018031 TaxID=3365033 RepID=UPI0037A47F5C
MSTDRLAGEDATPPEEEPETPTAADPGPEAAAAGPADAPEDGGPADPSRSPEGAAPADGGADSEGDRQAGGVPDDGRRPQDTGDTPRATGDTGGAASPGAPEGARKRSAAAEALAAAVRAVESGERSAASFFTEESRPAGAPRPGAPAGRPAGATPAPGGGPAGGGPAGGPAPSGVRPPAPRPVLADTAGIREVLAAGGAPEQLAVPVAEALGERAAVALREDPWQLLDVPGVRPEQADSFARALLGADCGPDDERRAQALVRWVLERAALEGHTALEADAVRRALAGRAVPDPDEGLRVAVGAGDVLVFQDALDEVPGGGRPATAGDASEEAPPVRVLLGLERFALAEESLADGLARLIGTVVPPGAAEAADGAVDGAADTAVPGADAWEAAAAGAGSPSAAELVAAVAGHGLVAHSGGEQARAEPVALVAAARAMGLRAYAAAHGENGRRRLAAALGAAPAGEAGAGREPAGDAPAVTVAGLLSGAEGPGRDGDGALALDLLAVLDAPQLDVETAAMLVESLPDGARLVLSGDPGVLWSAGPGRVFADLLAARRCPQVVSRTPDPGPIGELVSGIGVGELGEVAAPGKEVVIVPVRDAGEAVHRTVQLVADSVPRVIGVPADQVQVVTVGHGGAAGTRVLNQALKERLNPGPGQFGGFDPGDRVVLVTAPGRTRSGTVVSADAEGLRLDCAGTPLVVPREQVADAVRHGWAVTAHQAAGQRWPAAVVVLPGDAAAGLTRSWVYTAFSRGERHLSVVHGVEEALPRAVAQIPAKERTTRLRSLLEAQRPPAG